MNKLTFKSIKKSSFDELEKEIFQLHNKIRSDPQSYIPKLKEYLKYFRNKIYHPPGEDPIQTYEGPEAFEDAIQFLKTQKPVGPLEFNDNITNACRDHASDIGEKGFTSHEGSTTKNISERLEKYCEWDGACSESIDLGFRTAENVLINLLVDDGVSNRYQRLNIFNGKFRYIGIGACTHREYGICVVVGYAMNIRPLGSEPKNMSEFIQEYVNKTMNKQKKFKNPFQEEDYDAPDNTIAVSIVKQKKYIGGRFKKITKKVFLLDNGAQHIVEVEEA
jgi:uncharacterized protein YkwD